MDYDFVGKMNRKNDLGVFRLLLLFSVKGGSFSQ